MLTINIVFQKIINFFTKKQKIIILKTKVHGCAYYQCRSLLKFHKICIDDQLILRNEPENYYDKFAIEVFTHEEEKIGYIPKKHSQLISNIMKSNTLEVRVYYIAPREYEPIYIKIIL